jgi:hypothetical protein
MSLLRDTPHCDRAPTVDQQVIGEELRRAQLEGHSQRSLASGTFIDSQFYAVESKSSADMPKLPADIFL